MDNLIDTFANRLSKALLLRNMKPIELAEKSGIDKGKISSYVNGRYKANQNTLYVLATTLNVSPVWLLGYDVPINNEESNIFPITDKPISVPILGKISAGLPLLATENIEGYEFAPSSYIKEGFDYFYLRVNGDSMNLKFSDGDIVLVQKQDDLENDEIGVILVDGMDATVKKYKYENSLVILSPMSTNSEHVVQIYNPKDISIKIVGKVVSYQGKI
ncbi:helix-turn-helix domain-containing protein [bacterium]|nr:helix-turn-helix domain-containing protein [bacterium]